MRSITKIFILCLSLIIFFGVSLYSSEINKLEPQDNKKETKINKLEPQDNKKKIKTDKPKLQIDNKKDAVKSTLVFFPEPKFEFSEVPEGQEVTHDFILVNKGKNTLKINKVRTG